ncbi:MAG: Crp/Fnr family transcriptional regulator [Pseudomonadota bacterium]
MASASPSNRLLASLSPKDLARLRVHLEPVDLTLRQTLSASGKPIQHVYFPEHGMVSLVASVGDAKIEVGVICNEGVFGATVIHGVNTYPAEAMVQLPGAALRIETAHLVKETARSAALALLLSRFMHALHIQVAQSTACNRRHALPERLARWLLITRDRAESDSFPMTHEFLGMMLGSRRAGVTEALGKLKAAGLLATSSGRIQILDRKGLRAASCACYQIVKAEYERILPSRASGQ